MRIFKRKFYINELEKYINLNLNNEKSSSEFFNFEEDVEINQEKLFSKFKRSSMIFYDEVIIEDDEVKDDEVCESESRKIFGTPKINDFINEQQDDKSFQTLLFRYIDERKLKDSDVYNKVHIDRRLFSKIRSDKDYHPSRETVILLALSLELSEFELEKLLESASYSLPKNNHYDLIIRFCFINKIYKIKHINKLLEEYDCKLFNY